MRVWRREFLPGSLKQRAWHNELVLHTKGTVALFAAWPLSVN